MTGGDNSSEHNRLKFVSLARSDCVRFTSFDFPPSDYKAIKWAYSLYGFCFLFLFLSTPFGYLLCVQLFDAGNVSSALFIRVSCNDGENRLNQSIYRINYLSIALFTSDEYCVDIDEIEFIWL